MVLLNSKVYLLSAYVGSPCFTRMEKTVCTKLATGEDYPTMSQLVESATKEDQAHPENDFRNKYNPYISTDDQVYKGGIVAYTRNQKDRVSLVMPHNDQALWHLINLGVQDMPAVDKPWDASTHSMRFATCLADRLWVMLDREHARNDCLEERVRALEKALAKEVIDVDVASENAVHIYSAIKELRRETEDGWKKLAVPLDQVIKANNTSNRHLKQRDVDLTTWEDIMDRRVAHNRVRVNELQTKVNDLEAKVLILEAQAVSQERLCRCGCRATSELSYADNMQGQQNASPALSSSGTLPSSPPTDQSYQTPPVEQVTELVPVPEDIQLPSPNSSEEEAIPILPPRALTPGHQVQEQPGCSKAPPEYKGRLALNPILLDRTCLFGALEAGAFKLANMRMHQNVVLHHLGSSMTESAIFLRELTAMVGRPYWVAVMEELSSGELVRAALARQEVATHEEVVEDEETGVVSTVEVPDLMEEDERGSFGDPDQGVVLDESPVE